MAVQWLSAEDLKNRKQVSPEESYCSVEEVAPLMLRPFNSGNKCFVKQTLPRSWLIERMCQQVLLPTANFVGGVDCFAAESKMIAPFESVKVKLGFKVIEWPLNITARFTAVRSDKVSRANIETASTMIDPKDKNEMCVRLNNLSAAPFFVVLNQHICSLQFEKIIFIHVHEQHPQESNVQRNESSSEPLVEPLAKMALEK